ncbi:MAG: iron-containing alcohol dehydrogenase [Provencibacterium sp.]|nr:iron-containing alcohol dehydrogenase [Provencibacterium sp.]
MAFVISGGTGSVRFDPMETGGILSEKEKLSNKVTSNPVEKGADINDHVVRNPVQFTISGTAIGGMAAKAVLQRMANSGDILTYTGRLRISNVVIVSLDFETKSKNATGFDFTASFQTVNLVGAQQVETMSGADSGAPTSLPGTGSTANEGRKTVAESTISSGAYQAYVASYNAKQNSSAGPAARQNPSYSGVR